MSLYSVVNQWFEAGLPNILGHMKLGIIWDAFTIVRWRTIRLTICFFLRLKKMVLSKPRNSYGNVERRGPRGYLP